MLRKISFSCLLLSFLMLWGCNISGIIVDEQGVGVEGVTVVLSGNTNMETETDASGHYAFENNAIFNSDFIVTPTSDTYRIYPVSTEVSGIYINVTNVNFAVISDDAFTDNTPNSVGSPTSSDIIGLKDREPPMNGPVETPVECWSVLAPGVGGWGSPTCNLCIDQMILYDNLVLLDEPLTDELLPEYYKEGQIGLNSESTAEKTPKAFYPDAAWKDLIAEFQNRGYDVPITYIPPETLAARINWDKHHVPHIIGDEEEDVTYGLGYATVYSNMFELLLIRLVGTTGLLQHGMDLDTDVLSDPAGLFNEIMKFKPLNYTRAEMMDSMSTEECKEQLGPLCQEMLSTLVTYREGINQAMQDRFPIFRLFDMFDIPWPEWDVADSVAAGLAITGVFGDPGGDQLSNLETYRKIEAHFGADRAKEVYDDYKLRNVPVDLSTVTTDESFPSPVYADGSNENTPDRFIDPDSIAWVDNAETGPDSISDPEKPHASNWMIVSGEKSSSGRPLLVGGPQMAYIQPNIFFEFDARTADASLQMTGVTLPGLHMAAFAGNAHNGVWSPTAAGGKTADIFVEKLCSPDGEEPVSSDSLYYWHNGECKPMRLRKGSGISYTVHGPVVDRATVEGDPVAISKCSYHTERMGQSIFSFYLIAKGKVKTAQEFIDCMETFTLALNFGYINETEIAYINTGHYPVRAAGAQSDFPTWGTGEWDWQGVIEMEQRPHVINPESNYLLSWNNQAAPDFYLSDGGFQRVQLLDRLIRSETGFDLGSLAAVSELAALQDGYAITFVPLLLEFTGELPGLAEKELPAMIQVLTDWITEQQAKRLDLDEDGIYDDAGPAIMDEIMVSLKSVLEDNLSMHLGSLNLPSSGGSAYQDGTASLILMLLSRAINQEKDSILTCGDGTYEGCQSLVAEALVQARSNLIKEFETDVPSQWCKKAEKIELIPFELLTNRHKDWHWQNRPTFQQVATVH